MPLLYSPAEENKTQSKEGEDERVFLGFGDDVAVYPHGHSTPRKVRVQPRPVRHILNLKIPYRLLQQSRTHPRRSLPSITPVVEGAAHPNADIIRDIHIVHEHPSNRSADRSGAHSDGRRISGAGSKGDVRSAAARNSLSDRIDVYGIIVRK